MRKNGKDDNNQSYLSLSDPRFISKQVSKLIRNKIQPLSYKHYVLKSGNLPTIYNDMSLGESSVKTPYLANSRVEQKQNLKPLLLKNGRKKRRKALVNLDVAFNPKQYKQLQSKVEHHIMLKKILLMEDQFAQAEECNKEEKDKLCNKIWTSPLQKYIGMFEMTERPSDKVRMIDQASCQKILKQIKSVKDIKHIECMSENVRGMWNNDKTDAMESKSRRKIKDMKESANRMLRVNEYKLKKDIMSDIKRQYQNQGSSKIRININHHKMIQIV